MKTKRLYRVLAATTILAALSGCPGKAGKDADEAVAAPDPAALAEQAGGRPVAGAFKPEGFVLLQGLSLFTKDESGLRYANSAILGDPVRFEGKPEKLAYKGKEAEYLPVETAGGERYYARAEYVTAAYRLAAVVAEDCFLHDEPRDAKVTGVSIPRYTVLAVLSDEIRDGFVKVSYANEKDWIVRDKWVPRDALGNDEKTVSVAIAFKVADSMPADRAALKAKLLEGVARDGSGSAFDAELVNRIIANGGTPPEGFGLDAPADEAYGDADTGSLIPYAKSLAVNAYDVRVYDDYAEQGSVVEMVNKGLLVETSERTASAVTTPTGGTDYMYHIVQPTEGWVSGEFLDD